MADQKFQNGVVVKGKLKLPNEVANQALQINANGEITPSVTTSAELAQLSGVTAPVQGQLNAKLNTAEVGVSVAPLTGGKIPVQYLPNAIMEYQGVYDAALNQPTLVDGSGNPDEAIGNVYRVNVAGTVNFGSGPISFDIGDYVILNSAKVWEKADTTDSVTSVNGQQGAVVLDTDDINEGLANLYFTAERAQDAVGTILLDSATIDLTYDDAAPSITAAVKDASLSNQHIAPNAAIDATKIADGSVNNIEFQYLDGTIAPIQGQLDGKANTELSNLGTTAINADLLPANAGTINIGAPNKPFQTVNTTQVRTDSIVSLQPATGLTIDSDANVVLSVLTDPILAVQGNSVIAFKRIDMNNNKIVNLAAPVDAQDAANKAYVDAAVVNAGSPGDLPEASDSLLNNQASPVDVLGFSFDPLITRSFKALVSVEIDATLDLFESFEILGINKGSSFDITVSSVGDDSGVIFSITSLGQVQYTSASFSGFVSGLIKYRAITTTV